MLFKEAAPMQSEASEPALTPTGRRVLTGCLPFDS